MKYYVYILFILVAVNAAGQNRYGLLIGIGQYPETTGWTSIHGDNDVTIVKKFLIAHGFSEDNVDILTNSSATKNGIMTSLEKLMLRANDGDVIYIHFSGHGQQVTDLDGDENDHFDEAWVPYDAKKKYEPGVYEGENHILDDEINVYLNGLRAKVGPLGKIILVSDACHAGSGSRGFGDSEEVSIRGTDEKFIIPGSVANVIKKSAQIYWLYIGACKPYQTNYEYKSTDGIFYGSLSYVISIGQIDMLTSSYWDVVDQWRRMLVDITRYPQDIDDEGQPSRKSNLMF